MAKAIWNGQTIAESAAFAVVEGNVYFPCAARVAEHFKETEKTTACGWKGTANYYDVVVGG